MATSMSGAFVGRQREMGELKTALEEALSGHGQLVMLLGEPGIGKTRTAQELAAHAEQQGAQVLWGWSYEEAGAPPYWPWVQPIRSYVQQCDPQQMQADMGLGAADIAEIIPEIRHKLPDLEPPPSLEPEQARFRLFDSITTFLKNATQSRPLMLVLDDLHWADKPSLLLLQFLARQMEGSRLLVVGCYRDVELSWQHSLSETLAQLSRLPWFQRQLLQGLSQEDTGRFIETISRIRPPQSLTATIYAHTEGNPFFVKEVVRCRRNRAASTPRKGQSCTLACSQPGVVMPLITDRWSRLRGTRSTGVWPLGA
jgi:predicted ATPase